MAYYREENDLVWKRLLSARRIPRRARRKGPSERAKPDYPDGEYEPVEIDLADPKRRWPDIIVPIAQTPD